MSTRRCVAVLAFAALLTPGTEAVATASIAHALESPPAGFCAAAADIATALQKPTTGVQSAKAKAVVSSLQANASSMPSALKTAIQQLLVYLKRWQLRETASRSWGPPRTTPPSTTRRPPSSWTTTTRIASGTKLRPRSTSGGSYGTTRACCRGGAERPRPHEWSVPVDSLSIGRERETCHGHPTPQGSRTRVDVAPPPPWPLGGVSSFVAVWACHTFGDDGWGRPVLKMPRGLGNVPSRRRRIGNSAFGYAHRSARSPFCTTHARHGVKRRRTGFTRRSIPVERSPGDHGRQPRNPC